MVEMDLQKIRQLSEERQDENWKFRSWLKANAPDDIDEIVAGLSRKYFALIDCKECGNCCRSLEIVMEKSGLSRMAENQGVSASEFERGATFVDEAGDRVLKPPCPMLKGNLCSIYSDRPDTCRTFPHLEKSGFVFRLIGVIENLSVCPIVFNAFEELKTILHWRRNTR
jgi:Fe-S-cluster containining protein